MLSVNYTAKNNTIAIVGSNSGIGTALGQQLLKSEAVVFGMDIQADSNIAPTNNFKYAQIDPLKPVQIEAMAEIIGSNNMHIDGLVNLSGTLAHFKTIEELSAQEWQKTYDISFKSCLNSCKAFMPLLKQAPKAAVVNMSSGLAFGGQKNYGPYTTAKAAVASLSRTLATELAPNIRVNTMAPGAVDTPFIYKEDGTTRFDTAVYKNIAPLGRLAAPEEVAAVILFLLSDGSSHITGQCIHVNGGAFMV